MIEPLLSSATKLDNVSSEEIVSRFVYESKHYYKNGLNYIKAQALRPQPKSPYELSVYRIIGLCNAAVWELSKFVREDKKPKARGDALVSDIRNIQAIAENLNVLPQPKPHERHANISPMPLEKAQLQLISQQLCKLFKLNTPT